ncbi:hypothetical protein [Nocardioides pinisoli]|uniref:Uncharacterized protein n=1 Tax=Nocardioides pinisoli TaxID=2950279 RepID=A0ABT1KSF7_9ACTN|nr:hypothetical protein [Nocardioides pinisoli]MCP3420324.1 hypothetical protein [Nocardioides pinisoli]
MTEILDRTMGHHGPVVATAFRWVVVTAARSVSAPGLPLLPRDSAFIADRARSLVLALSRNAVAGVDVPRALRVSLRMTGEAWLTDPHVLVLDTTDPEAITEVATVCIELAVAAAGCLDVAPEEYVAGAVRVAIKQSFQSIAAALDDLE